MKFSPQNKVLSAKVLYADQNQNAFIVPMNESAFKKTSEFKVLHYYSKRKNRTEVFGAEYGAYLKVLELRWNSDKTQIHIHVETPTNHQFHQIQQEAIAINN